MIPGTMQLTRLSDYALRLLMFEALGGEYLTLEWKPPGAEEEEISTRRATPTENN